MVTVKPFNVTSVILNKTTDNLRIGDTDILSATVSPSNATNQAVSWSTSNPDVATVDSNGKVTAISVGTANITVTTEDGNFKADCVVTVNPINVTSVSLNKKTATLVVGQTDTLVATVSPTNATNQDVNWTSTDSSVATADASGKFLKVLLKFLPQQKMEVLQQLYL